MRLQDLEEWEGVTRDKVVAWLLATGWTACAWGYARDGFGILAYAGLDTDRIAGSIGWLADILDRTPQAILRDICPRMMKGWPSDADLTAHPGRWLMNFPDVEFIVAWEPHAIRERRDHRGPTNVECWPIDDKGNKVPLPARDGEGG